MERIKNFALLIAFLCFGIYSSNLKAQDYVTNDEGRTYYEFYDITMDSLESQASSSKYLLVKEVLGIQEPMAFGDADHDGNLEVYFPIVSPPNLFLRVWEFDDDLNYVETDLPYYGFPWDVGDIDGNGLIDIVVQSGDPNPDPCLGNGYLRIYEARDANSFPTELKDEVVLPPGRKLVYHAKIVDTDKDGKNEVLFGANAVGPNCGVSDMRIYEWENGSLVLKWIAPDIIHHNFIKAVADFDGDNNLEIGAVSELSFAKTAVYVYENTGNDQFNLVQSWSVVPYISEVAPSANLDGGNPELVVGGIHIPDDHYKWTFHKENPQNTFSEWWVTDFANDSYRFSPRHTTGDYDVDGFDEVLVLDYPTLKILEYENSQMQVTWSIDMFKPWIFYSADFRMDGYMNFVTMNIASQYENALKIWEAAFVTLPPTVPTNFAGQVYNNHPKPTWSLNSEPDISGYEIYRKLTGGSGVFELLTTVSSGTSSFVDTEIQLGGGTMGKVYYKIRAKDDTQLYSDFTSYVVYNYSGINKISIEGQVSEYKLFSNYPNPFNPSTQIRYSLAQDADVTLKVYDMLGTEVAELINEAQTAGSYEINFSSEGLSSGVYLYRITAANNGRILFTDSKQMILLR